MLILVILTLVVVLLIVLMTTVKCTEHMTVATPKISATVAGQRIQGAVVSRTNTKSIAECATRCAKTAQCQAVNWNKATGACELTQLKAGLTTKDPAWTSARVGTVFNTVTTTKWQNPRYTGVRTDVRVAFDPKAMKSTTQMESADNCASVCTDSPSCRAFYHNAYDKTCNISSQPAKVIDTKDPKPMGSVYAVKAPVKAAAPAATNPALPSKLVVNAGGAYLKGNTCLQFGTGNSKEGNVCFQSYGAKELSITGAGAEGSRNVKVWDNLSAHGDVRVGGSMRVEGKGNGRCIEMGAGLSGKPSEAGKICYQGWSDKLDVVGAAKPDGSRHVKVWDVLQTNGNLQVGGNKNCVEMGTGTANKQVDAGKMCYQAFTPDALDIVGAGPNTGAPRKVKVHDQLITAGDLIVGGNKNCIEMGSGTPGKEGSAGKICYQKWTDALEIVGAGTEYGKRLVHLTDITKIDTLRLGNKFTLSGVGSTVDGKVFNDEWLRLADLNNNGYFGGLAAGKLWSINGLVQRSDERTKRDVRDVRGDEVDQLMKLRPVAFKLKTEGTDAKEKFGFIAQQVERTFPDKAIVQTGPDGMKGVKYDEVVPLLLARAQQENKDREARLCGGGVCLDAAEMRSLKAMLAAAPRQSSAR